MYALIVVFRCTLSDIPLPLPTFVWFEIDILRGLTVYFLNLFGDIGGFTNYITSGDLRLDDLVRKLLRR